MPRLLGTLRRFGTELAIVLACVTLVGLVWGISLRMVAVVERKGVDSAFQDARGLARLFASQWSERLQRIDSMHSLGRLILRRQLAGEPGAAELLEELRRAVNLSGGDILQAAGLDAAGTALWSTLPMPSTPVSIANREHYQAVAHDGRDRFIGRPVRGIVSGRWTIQFTEAVRDPDRTLQGLTVVSVDAGLIRALTRELDMVDRGVIAIVREDGVVLARSEDRGIGEVVNPLTSNHQAVLQTGAIEWRGAGPLDGVRRFYAARTVPASGMIVSVGLDEAHLIAPVQSAVSQIHRSAGMLSVAIVALAAAAAVGLRWYRGLIEERQRSSELARREALLRQLAEQASDIISLLDADQRIIYVNPAYRTVLGFDSVQREGHVFGSAVLA